MGEAVWSLQIKNIGEKTMKLATLSIVFVCLLAIGVQAQAPAPGPASTAGNVWRVTYLDVKPGKGTDHSNFLRTNTKPILDEQKKQGLILDYKFFSKPVTDGPGDWDVAILIVFRNYAEAIDFNSERAAKFDAISLAHYGSADARTKAGDLQNELRTVISSQLAREQILNPMPK
jgi:hypothetical protein